jgi:glutamate/aspartate transport system substrate-binding protein
MAAGTLDKVKTQGYITIAYRESSIPFSYLDENKKPIGYAMDLCARVVDAVKQQLKMPRLETRYIAVTGSTRIPTIVNNQADLECGSTTNNAERRQQVAFTIPHYISGSRILVRSDSPIKSIDDLKGRTIVTTKGTTTVNILQAAEQARGLNFHLIEGKDHAESFDLVQAGKADAFVMDDVLLYSLRATSKNPKATAIVGDFLSVEPYAIMMRRDDPDFKKLVDSTVARIITDYEINKMYDKWFLSPIPPSGVNLDLPMNHLLRDSFKFPSDAVGD